MSHFVAQIQAYDALDQVHFIIRWRDYDEILMPGDDDWRVITAATQGRGSADPTRWLRELLEGMREAL